MTDAPMLHPQARMLLQQMTEKGLPPMHTLSPADARQMYRHRRYFTQPDAPAVAEVRDIEAPVAAGLLPLRLYRPQGSTAAQVLPVLVYFHGGGWTIGDLDTHDTLCRELANASGVAVASVGYRLAPEHRFPAAVDDALAATHWVRRHADALGVDPERLAVGGDSAGGNLAAVVALAARDATEPVPLPIRFQLLVYPATDMRRGAPSHQTNGEGFLLTRETVAYYHDHYIDDAAHDADWRASPLLHPDLSRLPPAFVLSAGFDPLRDEAHQYAQAMSEAGSRATLVCFERQIHGFITMGRVLHEAGAAISMCADALRRALLA